jgi:hypothetical protein
MRDTLANILSVLLKVDNIKMTENE